MIILKVTKNQGFTLSLEDTFFEKPQGEGNQIYFTLCRAYLSEVIWKKQQMRTNIQTSKLFIHQTMCLQCNVLRRKTY